MLGEYGGSHYLVSRRTEDHRAVGAREKYPVAPGATRSHHPDGGRRSVQPQDRSSSGHFSTDSSTAARAVLGAQVCRTGKRRSPPWTDSENLTAQDQSCGRGNVAYDVAECDALEYTHDGRSTRVKRSNRIPAVCEFLAKHFTGVRQQYEPVMSSKFVSAGAADLEMSRFVNYFLEAAKVASVYQTAIGTSFARLSKCGGDINRFCGVVSTKYTILPDGSLASCNRVHTSTVRETPFFLAEPGHFNLVKRKHYSLPQACHGCFARYNCKGGCYALRHSLNLDKNSCFPFCDEIRRLVKNLLLLELKKKGE